MNNLHARAGRATCPTCLRAQRTCICDLAIPVAGATEVLILQHPLEVHEAKGTARLLHLCLPNSRMVVGEQFDAGALYSLLYDPWPQAPEAAHASIPAQPVLLYPQAPGSRGAPSTAASSRFRLVVLDGTWRKSRKMLHLNPLLETLPRLSLADPAPSLYQIRKAHHPQQLSTLEAVHHALVHLEADSESFEPLLHAFSEFVAGRLRYAHNGRNTNGTH